MFPFVFPIPCFVMAAIATPITVSGSKKSTTSDRSLVTAEQKLEKDK